MQDFLIIILSWHLFPKQAFSDCVKDLLKPFEGDSVDLVAGIDAMGFILGTLHFVMLLKGQTLLRFYF